MEDIKSSAFHFIISDIQMIDNSAKYFLEKNKIVKMKEIRFEANGESHR